MYVLLILPARLLKMLSQAMLASFIRNLVFAVLINYMVAATYYVWEILPQVCKTSLLCFSYCSQLHLFPPAFQRLKAIREERIKFVNINILDNHRCYKTVNLTPIHGDQRLMLKVKDSLIDISSIDLLDIYLIDFLGASFLILVVDIEFASFLMINV